MFSAEELVEEYMDYYECPRTRAVSLVLADLALAHKRLLEVKAKEGGSGEGSGSLYDEEVQYWLANQGCVFLFFFGLFVTVGAVSLVPFDAYRWARRKLRRSHGSTIAGGRHG